MKNKIVQSGVHVSLFGRPIVWSISHFFGLPIFFWSTKKQYLIFLVDQLFFWSTKNYFLMFLVDQFFFWSTKKMRNWQDNWSTKETDQKYMDAAQWVCTHAIKTFLEKSDHLLNMSAIVFNSSTTCILSKQTTSTKTHSASTRGSATLCSTFWKGKFLIHCKYI